MVKIDCYCETLNMTHECTNGLYFLTSDGLCHDESNIQACAWDGGDCCRPQSSMNYCHFCECFEKQISYGTAHCVTQLLGDGICDDYQNVPKCAFDNGDCCIEDLVTSSCVECKCYSATL